MSTTPYKGSDLAQFIAKRILELKPKTQAEIASEAGFVNANYLSMLKSRNTKLALDQASRSCHALVSGWQNPCKAPNSIVVTG